MFQQTTKKQPKFLSTRLISVCLRYVNLPANHRVACDPRLSRQFPAHRSFLINRCPHNVPGKNRNNNHSPTPSAISVSLAHRSLRTPRHLQLILVYSVEHKERNKIPSFLPRGRTIAPRRHQKASIRAHVPQSTPLFHLS